MLRVLRSPINWNPTKLNDMVHEYGYYLDKEKGKQFGVLSEYSASERVNSFKDQCDYTLIMNELVKQDIRFEDFARTVELSDMLESGQYSLFDALDVVQEQFAAMPLEVKEKYENNYELFARDLVGGGFVDFIGEKYGRKAFVESVADGGESSDSSVEDPAGSVGGVDGYQTVGKSAGRDNGELERLRREVEELRKSGER